MQPSEEEKMKVLDYINEVINHIEKDGSESIESPRFKTRKEILDLHLASIKYSLL